MSYFSYPGEKVYHLSPLEITKCVSDYYRLKGGDVFSRSGDWRISGPRHLCMWVMRKYLKMSLPHIAKVFNQHHTTVIYAIKKAEGLISVDEVYRKEVEIILGRLKGLFSSAEIKRGEIGLKVKNIKRDTPTTDISIY